MRLGQLAVAEIYSLRWRRYDAYRPDGRSSRRLIDRLRRTTTFQSFLTSAARQIRAVTGYDRVMIYKFLEDDSGKVVAEAAACAGTAAVPRTCTIPRATSRRKPGRLFKRQWLRMIPDVDYAPVPIVPALTTKKLPLDLSLSTLRSASPIHIQYLKQHGERRDPHRVDLGR